MDLITLHIVKDFNRIKDIWTFLSSSSCPSFFMSWGWIEHWLRSLPSNISLRLAVVLDGAIPVQAFFVGEVYKKKLGIFKNKALFLNETGIPIYDKLHIEYNSILGAPLGGKELEETLQLLPDDWEEFYFRGLDPERFPGNVFDNIPFNRYAALLLKRHPCPYVDLDKVRRKQGNFLSPQSE